MLSCKQNLSFEIKVGVHIYLSTFQRIADVAHRIVSGCTPSLYHRSKIPFALCLAYAFIGSTVISKSCLLFTYLHTHVCIEPVRYYLERDVNVQSRSEMRVSNRLDAVFYAA